MFCAEDGSMVLTSFNRQTDAHSNFLKTPEIYSLELMGGETTIEFLCGMSQKHPTFVFAASDFLDDSSARARFSELDMNTEDTLHRDDACDIVHRDQLMNDNGNAMQQSVQSYAHHELPRKRFQSFVLFTN